MSEENLPPVHTQFFGEPSKPSGDTGLPSWDSTSQQPVNLPPIDESWKQRPSEETMSIIRTLPAEQQELVLAWWPHIVGKPSEFLGGKLVYHIHEILTHAEGFQKKQDKSQRQQEKHGVAERRQVREQRDQAQQLYSTAYMHWQEQCSARKQWIQTKMDEWHRRIEERRVAMEQWNGYVAESKRSYDEAKLVPPPPKPIR